MLINRGVLLIVCIITNRGVLLIVSVNVTKKNITFRYKKENYYRCKNIKTHALRLLL